MAITELFEYADTTALDLEWPETVSTLSIATWDIDASVKHQGAYAVQLTVSGTPAAGDEAVRGKTFTADDGILASTHYTLSMWVWLNEEFGDNTGHNIRFGIRVPGGAEAFVATPPGNTINDWTLVTLSAISDSDATLTVEFGAFDASATAHDRLARFDELTITSNPWADVLLEHALLSVGGAVVGTTLGGFRFDVGRKFRHRHVEGFPTPVVGLDLVESVTAKFVGSIITFNAAVRSMIEPGATTAAVGTTTTYTPVATATDLSSGMYLTNVACTWRRLGGGHLRVRFPYALCTKYDIDSKMGEEGRAAIEIEARLASGSTRTATSYYLDVIDD